MTSIEQLYSIFQKHPSVCTDTRALVPGSIFFALKGGNFNANKFARQALEGGCAYAVIDEKEYKEDGRFVLVNDVLKALQDLASHHRDQLNIPVIGITGSNGKTTTKELISAVLATTYNTYFTKGNLNNHIGVPLTLLSITEKHEIAVVEMGANHVGEIAELCSIAKPTHGMITNIGKAHLEGFGGPEGVKKGKSELYKFIVKNDGQLFVNQDDKVLVELAGDAKKITYGTSGDGDVIGEFLDAAPYVRFRWSPASVGSSTGSSEIVETQVIGQYNFPNFLAAACIGHFFKVSRENINRALSTYIPSNNRSQVMKKGSNTILLDAYNANPTSMAAALDNFSQLSSESKLLILGDMLELGDDSANEHQLVIETIASKKFDRVVLVGDHFSKVKNNINAKQFMNADEAMSWVKEQKIENTAVLIKGSRGIKLEKLVEVL